MRYVIAGKNGVAVSVFVNLQYEGEEKMGKEVKSKLIKFAGVFLTVIMIVGVLPLSQVVQAATTACDLRGATFTGNGFKKDDGKYYLNIGEYTYDWKVNDYGAFATYDVQPLCVDEACKKAAAELPTETTETYYEIVSVKWPRLYTVRDIFLSSSRVKLNMSGYITECTGYEMRETGENYNYIDLKFKLSVTDVLVRTMTSFDLYSGYCYWDNSAKEYRFGDIDMNIDWGIYTAPEHYGVYVGPVYLDSTMKQKAGYSDEINEDNISYVDIKIYNKQSNDHRIDFSKISFDNICFGYKDFMCSRVAIGRGVDFEQRDYVKLTFRIGDNTPRAINRVAVTARGSSYWKEACHFDSWDYTLGWKDDKVWKNTNVSLSCIYLDEECTKPDTQHSIYEGSIYYTQLTITNTMPNNHLIDFSAMRRYQCSFKIEGFNSECIAINRGVDDQNRDYAVLTYRIGTPNSYNFESVDITAECIDCPLMPNYNVWMVQNSDITVGIGNGYTYTDNVSGQFIYEDYACTKQLVGYGGIGDCAFTEYLLFFPQGHYVNIEDLTYSDCHLEIPGYYTDCIRVYKEETDIQIRVHILFRIEDRIYVEFDSNGHGKAPGPVLLEEAGYIDEPSPMEEEGYIFCGWYKDQNCTEEFNFNTRISSDMTLYAKWIPDEITVSFKKPITSNGNWSLVSSQNILRGQTVERPEDPSAPYGKVFAGWYSDPDLSTEFDFGSPVRDTMTLYAKFADSAKVTFDCHGATGSNFSIPSAQTVAVGGNATDPWPNGFTTPDHKWKFQYWCTDEACTKRFYFSNTVTGDITLYAKWEWVGTIKVTILPNGHSSGSEYYLDAGQKLRPIDRSDYDYTVVGYYLDAECTQEFDLNTPIYDNLTLYFKWVANPVITFVVDGEVYSTVKVRYNKDPKSAKVIPDPAANGRDGYEFSGWFNDEDCTDPFNGYIALTSDKTVYGKWNKIAEYTVTFDSMGGSEVPSQTVVKNGVPVAPEDPVRAGYTFTGWYYEEECVNRCYFNSPVGKNFTLYAGWEQNSYNIYLTTEGYGKASLSCESAGIGTEVTVNVNDDEVEQILFWENRDGVTIEMDITSSKSFTMPANEVTVKVVFKAKLYTVTVEAEGNGRARSYYEGTEGTEITLDYVVPDGFELKEWVVIEGDVTIVDDKFTIGTSDVKIKAVFGPVEKGEWIRGNGGWTYKNPDGSCPKSEFKEIDGKKYYFNEEGIMATRWNQIDGVWYFMGNDGAVRTGWLKDGAKWYYLNESGEMQTGWQEIDDEWYYFSTAGVMQTGWNRINGKWYFFEDSGKMKTGWLDKGGKCYYLDDDGAMVTGWERIDRKWYFFNDSGIMHTGWLDYNGHWYYLDDDGVMVTGWERIDGRWYFFDDDGVMHTGWLDKDGKWYYLENSGEMTTGWKNVRGRWYYLLKDGTMATGEVEIDGKINRFSDSGEWYE